MKTRMLITIATIALTTITGCTEHPTAGKPWTNSLGMRFVPVPETSLLFCVFETRRGDYTAFKKATGHEETTMAVSFGDFKSYSWDSPGFDQTDAHPVVQVDYEGAKAFCKWLTDTEQQKGLIGTNQYYRLPTSQEWTKALRGSTTKSERFPWGDVWPPPQKTGNFFDTSGKARYEEPIKDYTDSYANTAPVGSFSSNSIGLYDMSGNAWELCEDLHKADTAGSSRDMHIIRGGSFMSSQPDELESEYSRSTGGSYVGTIGFRCVLVVDDPSHRK